MTASLVATVLPGLLALGGPACVAGASGAAEAHPAPALSAQTLEADTRPAQDTLTGPGDVVPFVAQGPLLCGGASAAMLERWWGALGVYGEDYADLVAPEEGGIRTGALAGAMEARGYEVRVLRDDPAGALALVRADHPVIALIESGAARYHYVVLIAVGPDRIRYHDPLKGPGRTTDRADFMRRWAAADHWALTATPAPRSAAVAPPDTAPPARADTTPLPLSLRRGLEALRAGRTDSAAALVEVYLRRAPADAPRRDLAWEMLATARYLAGDPLAALAAWNRVGQPPVDLVEVRGLDATRHSAVTDATGIRRRATLTPGALRLARRRVQQLPAVQRSRVGYRPLRDGSVAVQVFLLERRRLPFSPLDVVSTGLGALINRDAGVELGPVLPVGERWRVRGSWREARSLAEGSVAVPWSPLAAVATLRAGWTEERYATGSTGADVLGRQTRTWGLVSVDRWVTAGARLGVTAGLERWGGGDRLGRVGLSALRTFRDDRVRLGAALDGWAGPDGRFGRGRAAGRLRIPNGLRAWTLTLGGSWVSRGAPPTVWDGAGTGQVRAPLLRGHPLIRDGRVRGDALGRGLAHGTLAWGWHLPAGPAAASLELFVDAARVWDPLGGGGPRSYVDPGIELGVTSPTGAVALALARGGDDWVLSARVDAGGLPWLAVP